MIIVILTMLFLCSCADTETESLALSEQTPEQLGIEQTERYIPLNYDTQKALWFTMMDWEDILYNKSEEDFTADISALLDKIKDMGFNTLYLHLRPYGDAYYQSSIFPKGQYCTGDYDPLDITLSQAHERSLSVHGWINPLRCGTDKDMQAMSGEYTVKKWYNTKRDSLICKAGERWYLNPAYEEVRTLIADGAKEIAENYDIDGLNIDDYFYPTTDNSFDSEAFSQSGSSDLSAWRTNNIDLMVKEIYDAVKSSDENILFGISPQGNMDTDVKTLYADVRKWASCRGYCDYIAPQLYYGFKNEALPFEPTLGNWISECTAVKLVAGICTYKIGKEDKWAGSGIDEWINDTHIPSREAQTALTSGVGVAVYSIGSLFDENTEDEQRALRDVLCSEEDI